MSRSRPAGADDGAGVEALLAKLEHPRRAEIDALRTIIRRADPRVREAVKWNAPSFHITEHFATFHLRAADRVQIVLHTGARARPRAEPLRIDDPAGLLEWRAADRCLATFTDMRDVEAKGDAFAAVLRQWIGHLFGSGAEPAPAGGSST
jgi:hypothetical protein